MATFRPDRSGLRRLEGDARVLGDELELIARRIAVQARKIDPPGAGRTKAFDKRLTFTRAAMESGQVTVHVHTTWRLAHLFEFGSINTRPYRPLSQAVEGLGLRLEGGGR